MEDIKLKHIIGLIKSYQKSKQQLNITYQGTIYHTYNSLARACGINASTLRDRHNHGLRGSALFIKPKVTKKRKPKQEISIKYQGKKYTTFSSLARKTGISKNTIRDRWNRGIHDPNLLVKTQVVSSKKKNSFFKLVVESLGDPIIKILLLALAIKTIFLFSDFDWFETLGIIIAILIVSLIKIRK